MCRQIFCGFLEDVQKYRMSLSLNLAVACCRGTRISLFREPLGSYTSYQQLTYEVIPSEFELLEVKLASLVKIADRAMYDAFDGRKGVLASKGNGDVSYYATARPSWSILNSATATKHSSGSVASRGNINTDSTSNEA